MHISIDNLAIGFCSLLCVGFLSAAAIQWHKSATYSSGTLMQVSAASVVGTRPDFLGNSSSQFTLVEFGDYECPPCRALFMPLQRDLKSNASKMRFEFRNFPLTAIHPYAYDAAVLAEVAREKNKYWSVHDALYEQDINLSSLQKISKKFDLGSEQGNSLLFSRAKEAVNRDIKDGKMLGVSATPTFILCHPNGDAIKMNSLQALPSALNEKL